MKKFALTLLCIFLLGVLSVVWIVPFSDIQKLKSEYVHYDLGEKNAATYTIGPKRPKYWRSIKDISPRVINAIIVSEDSTFYTHMGIDLEGIKSAISDRLDGKRLRGASTITQQLAKNLFFSQERSFFRKLGEVPIAIVMERELEKKKILEIYLNILHLGERIHGIENASQYYFKKRARDLSVKEAAFLAMLLPNPVRYSESFSKKKLTAFAEGTIKDILTKMKLRKMISEEEYVAAVDENFWKKAQRNEDGREGENFLQHKDSNIGRRGNMQKYKNTNKGKDFDEIYRNDPELNVPDEIKYDDDALIEDESGLAEEFNID